MNHQYSQDAYRSFGIPEIVYTAAKKNYKDNFVDFPKIIDMTWTPEEVNRYISSLPEKVQPAARRFVDKFMKDRIKPKK